MQYICGIDEVGRGSVLGPLVVAGVVLNAGQLIEGVKDSKKVAESARGELVVRIMQESLFVNLVAMDNVQVDVLGIQKAWESAVVRVILECQKFSEDLEVVVDGGVIPRHKYITVSCKAEPKADDKYCSVGAASNVAKWYQVKWMHDFNKEFPKYQADTHKGYLTKAHSELLIKYGLSEKHRSSFLKKFS